MTNSKDKRSYFNTDHLQTKLKKHAVSGGSVVVLARMTSFVVQMLGTVFLARLLTPEDFGFVAMVTIITGFFLIFKDLGLTEATIQRSEINHEQINALFWINIGFSIFLTLLTILLSSFIADFYGEPLLRNITIVSSFSFIFAGLSTQHLALLKRNMYFTKIAANEIVAVILSVSFVVIAAWLGLGYWALVVRPLVLAVSIVIGSWILCSWRPSWPKMTAGVFSMLIFGANTVGFYFINYVCGNLHKILLGRLNGAQLLGFYNKAHYLSAIPVDNFTLPLHAVAVSTLSKLQGDKETYNRYYLNAVSTIALVGIPMSLFMAVASKEIILILLGSQWIGASTIFSILSLGITARIISGTNGWIHVSLGRTDRWLRWGITASLATLTATLLGLPFGVTGIAIGYSVVSYLLVGPCIQYAGKPIGLTFWGVVAVIWHYYLSAILAGVICFYVMNLQILSNVPIRLLIGFIVYCVIYLFMVVIVFRDTKALKEVFLFAKGIIKRV
ncbi:MAG: lipopolysaccharide biosynthesis protein [Colwellia sp.]|nr:lipopolysaccharide biosynthesis protein [Colwellia sp.]